MGYEKTLIGPPLWLSAETLQAIIEEASGELARNHFRHLEPSGANPVKEFIGSPNPLESEE